MVGIQFIYGKHWKSLAHRKNSIHLAAAAAAAAAKSLQSCPTLCNPIDGSPPGSPVPGILQARTLEWVAISFSSAWKWKVKVKSLSCVRLLVTPWTAAHQVPPSMGFSRQEYWSGVPYILATTIISYWASWIAQWLKKKKICLSSRRSRFDPWSGKIPHVTRQLSPCATTTEARVPRACVPK